MFVTYNALKILDYLRYYLKVLEFKVWLTYHFCSEHSHFFPPVSVVPNGVGLVTKSTHQTCDHSLHVFLDHLMDISLSTWSLGRCRYIQSRGSERTQMDGQQ